MEMPTLKPLPFPKGRGYFFALFTYTPRWMVMEDYQIALSDFVTILIPRGFIFDGASIPKMFRGLLSPVGILLVAAIAHDYAYQYHYIMVKRYSLCPEKQHVSKHEADRLFLRIANQTNGLPWLNRIAYLAVRDYGINAWSKGGI
jgi:hypothetical protein